MGFQDELFYGTLLGPACQKLRKIKISVEVLSLNLFRVVLLGSYSSGVPYDAL
jgi:hypothetical protein